jgi:hypothetical protein
MGSHNHCTGWCFEHLALPSVFEGMEVNTIPPLITKCLLSRLP